MSKSWTLPHIMHFGWRKPLNEQLSESSAEAKKKNSGHIIVKNESCYGGQGGGVHATEHSKALDL